MTIGIVICGGVLVTGVAGLIRFFNQKKIKEAIEAAQKQIKELEKELETFKKLKNLCHNIMIHTGDSSESAYYKLKEARNIFKDKGHVYQGIPLENDRFEIILTNLNDLNINIKNLYSELETAISKTKEAINDLEDYIDDLE